jgi:hypothetical protein
MDNSSTGDPAQLCWHDVDGEATFAYYHLKDGREKMHWEENISLVT